MDKARKSSKDCKKISKRIVKTRDSICKKYHALKTDEMDEDIALEKHFMLIIKFLKQIVQNTLDKEFVVPKSRWKQNVGEEELKPKQIVRIVPKTLRLTIF